MPSAGDTGPPTADRQAVAGPEDSSLMTFAPTSLSWEADILHTEDNASREADEHAEDRFHDRERTGAARPLADAAVGWFRQLMGMPDRERGRQAARPAADDAGPDEQDQPPDPHPARAADGHLRTPRCRPGRELLHPGRRGRPRLPESFAAPGVGPPGRAGSARPGTR